MIRQLSFEEGASLNISSCTRLPKNTSVEELKDFANKEDILIVQSGKSYYDVTNKPEIFEQAHEFNINALTEIERRELRREAITPAFSEQEQAETDPMTLLFKNTTEEQEEEYDRKTYYLQPVQIEVLRLLCYREVKDVSEMMRELVDIGIAEKSKQHSVDLRKEAIDNLQAKPRKAKKRKKRKGQI